MNYSALQNTAIERALEELRGHSWFRGVCLDNLPTDYEIERDGMDSAVSTLVFDTIYWDAPNSGF